MKAICCLGVGYWKVRKLFIFIFYLIFFSAMAQPHPVLISLCWFFNLKRSFSLFLTEIIVGLLPMQWNLVTSPCLYFEYLCMKTLSLLFMCFNIFEVVLYLFDFILVFVFQRGSLVVAELSWVDFVLFWKADKVHLFDRHASFLVGCIYPSSYVTVNKDKFGTIDNEVGIVSVGLF